MGRFPYTIEELQELKDTGDVDTMSLLVAVKLWIQDKDERKQVVRLIRNVSSIEQKKIKFVQDGILKDYTDTYYNTKITKPSNKNCTLYGFSYRCLTGYLSIRLKHSVVHCRSANMIIKDIKQQMSQFFHIPDKYIKNIADYICLGRIDYKRDYPFRSLEEYYLIRQIIDIAPKYIVRGNYRKQPIKDSEYMYMMAYKSESNKTVEFVIYNKDLEQRKQLSDKKIDEEEYDLHYNTIRFEVRILNAKLNSMDIPKDIFHYKKKEMAEKLFNYYAEKAFFKEPMYYRIDVAKKLVNKSNENKNMKEKLCTILDEINERGYTVIREKYSTEVIGKKGKQQRNYTQFNRYIERLQALNINPLTFKKYWVDEDGDMIRTTYKEIPNFTLLENRKEEEGFITE